jgi:hypothetical protein
VKIISKILSEMAALFPDEVMKTPFCFKSLVKNSNDVPIYRDRLGTNIENAESKGFFLQVMNIGSDETGSAAPCTLANTKSFEVAIIEHLCERRLFWSNLYI